MASIVISYGCSQHLLQHKHHVAQHHICTIQISRQNRPRLLPTIPFPLVALNAQHLGATYLWLLQDSSCSLTCLLVPFSLSSFPMCSKCLIGYPRPFPALSHSLYIVWHQFWHLTGLLHTSLCTCIGCRGCRLQL